MKEVTINLWCDPHDADDGRRVPATVTRTFPGWLVNASYEVTLDLCDGCDHDLLDPVRSLLASHGALPEGQPSKRRRSPSRQDSPEAVSCPDCNHPAPNRHALGAHTRTTHGKGLKDYIAEGTLPAVPQGRAAHQVTQPEPLKAV